MRCNTSRMNSWHSWSPNGKWLVFSSKCNSAYTQLFLTHVDSEGRSSPAVVLAQFTAPEKAANIPEFVNASPGAIQKIRQRFVDDTSFLYAGQVNARTGFHDAALRDLQKAIELNPKNVAAHIAAGNSLAKLGKLDEAEQHFVRAIEIEPDNPRAHEGLGNVLAQQRKFQAAVASFREALRLDPNLAVAHFRLGVVLMDLGQPDEARKHLLEAVRLDPLDARASYSLGVAFASLGKPSDAATHLRRAVELEPDFVFALVRLASILATSSDPAIRNAEEAVRLATRACKLTQYEGPTELATLSEAYAAAGRVREAVATAERALEAARKTGDGNLAEAIRQRIDLYQRGESFPESPPR
jgi:tetratricopeptide (TPR) repeat protein